MIKKVLLILLLLLLINFIFAGTVGTLPSHQESMESKIKKILKERVDKYGTQFGIVVGIVNEKGSKVINYGKLSRDSSQNVDGSTLFELGSVTKLFSATLLADMVERNEVNLNDPIEKFLPKSIKVPTKDGKKITLLHLVTHTSGLPNTPDNSSRQDDKPGYVGYTKQQLYDFLSNHTLTGGIGSRVQYSNLGMGLLGHILTLRSGIPYEAMVIKRICEPLEMHSTRRKLSPELRKRLAEGKYLDGQVSKHWQIPSLLAGAGGFRSTANDMLKFLAANMGVIKSPLLTAMQKTHMGQ